MPIPRRILPPLNAVRAFEAAARHGSFKEAAIERGGTHGALTQQVRALEGCCGAAFGAGVALARSTAPRHGGRAPGGRSTATRMTPLAMGLGGRRGSSTGGESAAVGTGGPAVKTFWIFSRPKWSTA